MIIKTIADRYHDLPDYFVELMTWNSQKQAYMTRYYWFSNQLEDANKFVEFLTMTSSPSLPRILKFHATVVAGSTSEHHKHLWLGEVKGG